MAQVRKDARPETDADAALVVKNLSVMRGDAPVVQNVDFVVARHGVTALLGRNGAGKTTTLLGLLGLLRARGSASFGGNELVGCRTHDTVRLGIGYVPENREVFTQLTVRENLRLAERSPEARHRYELVYDLFPELQARGSQAAGTLSGGQQQMLALGRALLNPNRMLLVDEPSEGLAPAVVNSVVEALHRTATDTAILLVEQNLKAARQLATDVVVLADGRVVHTGLADSFFADEALALRHLGVVARPDGETR
ncbi:MAG: hypothetical protein ABS81_00930 [Pseudonocardia sp. SCN 72-86]|nr:MAG: hypothetical protein ABS81_00930 [Pseudonocardia sp. SCN 72-86]